MHTSENISKTVPRCTVPCSGENPRNEHRAKTCAPSAETSLLGGVGGSETIPPPLYPRRAFQP
jgi:hypothetical protein